VLQQELLTGTVLTLAAAVKGVTLCHRKQEPSSRRLGNILSTRLIEAPDSPESPDSPPSDFILTHGVLLFRSFHDVTNGAVFAFTVSNAGGSKTMDLLPIAKDKI
jgi:hypothetical protein